MVQEPQTLRCGNEVPGPPPPRSGRPLAELIVALDHLRLGQARSLAGDRQQALSHYGWAIDEFLRQGLYTMAASTSRQLLDRCPEVVRARGTLAVLSLGEGLRVLSPGVLRLLSADFDAYIRAARAAGQTEAAAHHLRLLSEETEMPAVREWLAGFIEVLGDRAGAEEVFLNAFEEREGIRPSRRLPGSQQERWASVLRTPSRSGAEG